MTREEKALIYFKELRERKLKDYSSIFNTAPKDSVVYEAVSAEIEIYDTTIKALEQESVLDKIRAEIEQNAYPIVRSKDGGRRMTLDEAINMYINNAEYERTHGSLQECFAFRQLVQWLSELKVYKERIPSYEAGYNDAKREITLSGEYGRAYEHGKAYAQTERWIPVTERLPAKNGSYLIQVDSSDGTATITFMTVDHYNDDGTWLHYDNKRRKVVAWMPLPNPYKESEEKN